MRCADPFATSPGGARWERALQRPRRAGSGTLSAGALVTAVATAALSTAGTLTAIAIVPQPGSAALSAPAALSAWSRAGPDPDALWDAYVAAQRSADMAEQSWEETVIAGGSGGQSGMTYAALYPLQLAASHAYASWLAARDAWA